MGLWDGLSKAEVFENGVYLGPGIFDCEIVRCLVKDSQKSGMGFIAELEILQSSNPEHPAGVKRTWWQGMKNKNVAFGAIKDFMLQIFCLPNVKERETDFDPYLEAFMDRATGAENVLSGMFVHVECTMIKTREKQLDFTKHDWSPFDFANARAHGLDIVAPQWAQYRSGGGRILMPPPPPPVNARPKSPDGTLEWDGAAWVAVQAAPPPPPAPVALPPPPWDLPGAVLTADKRHYLTAGNTWAPIPGR